MASLFDAVRSAIYDIVVTGAAAPTVDAVSAAVGTDTGAVASVFQALAASHVIVLHPSTLDIAWAPPFALTPTPFRSNVGRSAWHAPCAWDAFGIPAALNANDAAIEARCAWSGDPIDCGVERGHARGDAVIHLLVPAAHFWDDIFFT
jgi:Alkylmercury lyase